MEILGMTRKLDGLGRIVLPNEYRKELGLNKFDMTMIYLLEEGIFIKKYGGICALCSENKDLIELNKKMVCKKCLEKLNELVK